MKSSIGDIQREVAKALNALPGVFSTVQWGGRAYKLPGPGGSRKKPKLLAHVCLEKDNRAVSVGFKLPREKARDVVKKHKWIEPSSFGSMGKSGWVTATVRTKTQCSALAPILAKSRALYPGADETPTRSRTTKKKRTGKRELSAEAQRIERVMRGLSPQGQSRSQSAES